MEHLAADKPLYLLAELTHRCALGCPYCSNPLALEPRDDELDAATWARVFGEAKTLGIQCVHLSGGEPGMRRDLVDIAAHAREAGLHTRLVTSGVGISARTLRDLWEAGLEQVEVSFQDADAVASDRIAGSHGAFQRKHAFAAEAVRLGLPLTINLVAHRTNIAGIANLVDLALGLKARGVEIVHLQHRGWALKNGAALTPNAVQMVRAAAEVEELRRQYQGRIVIDTLAPDGHERVQRFLTITPSGRVLPWPAAESFPDGRLGNVRDHSLADIWTRLPLFDASRAADAPSDLCANSERRAPDFAGIAAMQEDAGYVHRRM
jgi:pyrroloquinoline quinone biosynthesis protein E